MAPMAFTWHGGGWGTRMYMSALPLGRFFLGLLVLGGALDNGFDDLGRDRGLGVGVGVHGPAHSSEDFVLGLVHGLEVLAGKGVVGLAGLDARGGWGRARRERRVRFVPGFVGVDELD